MAPRSMEILAAESRSVKKLLASLGALLEGFAGNDAPEPSTPQDKEESHAHYRDQDGPRSRR